MKKIFSTVQRSAAKGFTLIELLVVIGILGVMAAALVATIDPFEQLKKANDSNLQNEAVEFVNANLRYYTTHNALPWYPAASGGADCYSGGSTISQVTLDTLTQCMQLLVGEGELKSGFMTAKNLNKLTVTNPNPITANPSDTVVCFLPESRSLQANPATRFAQDATLGTSCKSAGGTTDCYWCTQ